MALPDDAADILEIYRPFVTGTVVTFEELVPTVEEFRQRIKTVLEEAPYLVCEIDGVIVGYAYASAYRTRASYRWNREVTVYINPDFQGMNIGTALYTALIAMLRMQHYGNLLAVVTLPNEGSARLHERMGFKACAVFNQVGYKMNKWHQVGWWELALADPDEKPLEPVLLKDIDDNIVWDKIMRDAADLVKI